MISECNLQVSSEAASAMFSWKDRTKDHVRDETLLDALRSHVELQGDRVAYTFLQSDTQTQSLTYRQLDRRARSIARALLSQAVVGERALMMYPAGLEFIEAFLGCLYAGIIAVPAYPPKRNRNAERIFAIAGDCRPRLLLSTTDMLESVPEAIAGLGASALVMATDTIQDEPGAGLPAVRPQSTAFLQYTSGSTGAPKGVIVSHANLLANERSIQQVYEQTRDSVVCGWLPAFHDMGLIGIILQPLFVGCQSVLLPPVSFISKPARWLRAMSDFRATGSGAPNFAYEHCLKLVRPEECSGLDLSRWRVAFSGSEPVQESTIRDFAERFGPYGFSSEAFFPCYGLAEATLIVSGRRRRNGMRIERLSTEALENRCAAPASIENESKAVVSCGPIVPGTEVRIVEPETGIELSDGRIGEIWVRGESVSEGYWRNPRATHEVFRARIADANGHRSSAYLRTGDLGFLSDGELFVTGRLKDLVIIGGRNIYPQDVEGLIESNLQLPTPNSVAAFGFDVGTQESLAVVIQADREQVQLARQLGNCRESLPERIEGQKLKFCATIRRLHQIVLRALDVSLGCVAYLAPGDFPRTSSGKVQRQRCRLGLKTGDLPFLELPMCAVPSEQWPAQRRNSTCPEQAG